MINAVVQSYENYREEDRLTTNNARKIEFLTTTRILDEHIKARERILDCAAGTGAYAFYFADKGHCVTATDITPRHVDIMKEMLANKEYDMHTAVLDATDMSVFGDASFDVVLNMGPMYHLIDDEAREKCFRESIRVLKPGGLLVTAYIPRHYLMAHLAMGNEKYLDEKFVNKILETGKLDHADELCFWTDSYYATCHEMEEMYRKSGLTIVDHFAQDGITPHFSKVVDGWSEEHFGVWTDYHYKVCREKSLIGMSNHVVIMGRKSEI